MTETVVPTVAQALANVMGEVQSISKDQRVTSGPAKFNFRGVDATMQAVGPALRKHGVIFAPSRILSLEQERYETTTGSKMHGVVVVVEYVITGPAGDEMVAAAAGQAADSGDKAVPKAMSVAFRTVLLQALCVPTGDPDPDSSVHERAGSAPTPPPEPTDWLKLLAEATTSEGAKNLGRRAAVVGEFAKYEAQFRTRVGELEAKEMEIANQNLAEGGLTGGPKASESS